MKINQNDNLLNFRIAKFYDTPEQRQLLSSYNAPSIEPLVKYQLNIHRNYQKTDSTFQINEPEKWSILSSITKNTDTDYIPFNSDQINSFDEQLTMNALADIEARINIIHEKH